MLLPDGLSPVIAVCGEPCWTSSSNLCRFSDLQQDHVLTYSCLFIIIEILFLPRKSLFEFYVSFICSVSICLAYSKYSVLYSQYWECVWKCKEMSLYVKAILFVWNCFFLQQTEGYFHCGPSFNDFHNQALGYNFVEVPMSPLDYLIVI